MGWHKVQGIYSVAGDLSAPVADTGRSYRFSTLELLNESKNSMFLVSQNVLRHSRLGKIFTYKCFIFISFLGIFSKS